MWQRWLASVFVCAGGGGTSTEQRIFLCPVVTASPLRLQFLIFVPLTIIHEEGIVCKLKLNLNTDHIFCERGFGEKTIIRRRVLWGNWYCIEIKNAEAVTLIYSAANLENVK